MPLSTMLTRNVARTLVPRRRYLHRVGSPPDGTVYLTFDDGPDADVTPRVLDQLASIGAKATFFVLGQRIAANRALLRRTREEGHALGSHGWGHLRASETTAATWLDDADRGIAELQQAIGEECRLFRPAFGELTPRILAGMLRRRMQIAMWSHDPRDYAKASADEFCDWFRASVPDAGSIVLLHDNNRITGEALSAGLGLWPDSVRFDALPTG